MTAGPCPLCGDSVPDIEAHFVRAFNVPMTPAQRTYLAQWNKLNSGSNRPTISGAATERPPSTLTNE